MFFFFALLVQSNPLVSLQVGMPLAQLAAHHFIASATLGRLAAWLRSVGVASGIRPLSLGGNSLPELMVLTKANRFDLLVFPFWSHTL